MNSTVNFTDFRVFMSEKSKTSVGRSTEASNPELSIIMVAGRAE